MERKVISNVIEQQGRFLMKLFKVDKANSDRIFRIKFDETSEHHKKQINDLIGDQARRNMIGQGLSLQQISELYAKQVKELSKLKVESLLASIVPGDLDRNALESSIIKNVDMFIVGQMNDKKASLSRNFAARSFPKSASTSLLSGFASNEVSIKSLCKDMIQIEINNHFASTKNDISQNLKADNYIDSERIAKLKSINNDRFDLLKLIQLCEEMNVAYKNNCFLSVAMIGRAILDHIPPIFGFNTFSQVVNNSVSSKSFKESMANLERALRKIADSYLHTAIRKKESLPTYTQVNFAAEFDFLLSEIIILLD